MDLGAASTSTCATSILQEFTKRPVKMLYMPLWSKEDLDRCRGTLYDIEQQRLDDLYAKYGGVVRNVLEKPANQDPGEDLDELNQAVSTCDMATVGAISLTSFFPAHVPNSASIAPSGYQQHQSPRGKP